MSAIIDYRGKTPRKVSFGVPLITAKIVKGGRIHEPEEFIAEEDYDDWMQRGLPKKGDVVFTTEAPLGEVAQLDGRKVALAQRLITLRGKLDVLDNNFLKFLMQSDFVQEQLHARSTGTTVLGIRQSELRKVILVVPPLDEQRAIGRILGALDDKIELNRQMNRTLEALAQSLFKSWFVDFDPVTAKAAGRKPYGMNEEIAALFPDAFEDALGMIPRGWHARQVKDLGSVICGKTPSTKEADNFGSDIPFITIPDMHGVIFISQTERSLSVKGAESQAKKYLPENSICVSCIATPGLVCITSQLSQTNQQINSVVPKAGISAYFCYWLLRNLGDEIRAGGSGGTVFHNLNTGDFSRIEILMPSDPVIDAFHSSCLAMMNLILDNQKQLQTLYDLRDLLLPKLLSGEIRVRQAENLVAEAV